jgi:hypothetical protein
MEGRTMQRRNVRRALAAAAVCGLTVVGVGGGAFAGEVTGNGKSLKNEDGTLNGRSECAFSGFNDTYSGDPDVPDADGFTRTQSWGQLPKEDKEFLTSIDVNPGNSCNPHRGEHEG